MREITVLVTACGAQFMPGLSYCFRNNGERKIRLIGTDLYYEATIDQMVDKAYEVPSVNASEYADRLIEICGTENVDVIIPFISAELPILRARKKDFEAVGTRVSVSDNASVDIANNKLKLYQFMQEKGLAVPGFRAVRKANELESACLELGYPSKAICIKATENSGSRGIRIIDPGKSRFDIFMNEKPNSLYISLDEMHRILSEKTDIPEFMAMEYLPGEEYSVDLLAEHGKVLYIAGRESNVVLASIPQEATIKRDSAAYKISCDVIEKLELDGSADLDFKYDDNDRPVLMEINPRIAATMALFAVGGLNLPYLRVKQLLGEALPEVNVRFGVKMKRRYMEMFA